MENHYYHSEGWNRFGHAGKFQKNMANEFFGWYNVIFKQGGAAEKEKLVFAPALKCPFCTDVYSGNALKRGWIKSEMIEAVYLAAAITGGADRAHGVQIMNKVKEIAM